MGSAEKGNERKHRRTARQKLYSNRHRCYVLISPFDNNILGPSQIGRTYTIYSNYVKEIVRGNRKVTGFFLDDARHFPIIMNNDKKSHTQTQNYCPDRKMIQTSQKLFTDLILEIKNILVPKTRRIFGLIFGQWQRCRVLFRAGNRLNYTRRLQVVGSSRLV